MAAWHEQKYLLCPNEKNAGKGEKTNLGGGVMLRF